METLQKEIWKIQVIIVVLYMFSEIRKLSVESEQIICIVAKGSARTSLGPIVLVM